jgi:hypothetical protein
LAALYSLVASKLCFSLVEARECFPLLQKLNLFKKLTVTIMILLYNEKAVSSLLLHTHFFFLGAGAAAEAAALSALEASIDSS